jgi:hypothetical protein
MERPAMISLSDDQLTVIFNAAQPLAAEDRSRFLETVARKLEGRELGDGIVARCARETQREFFRPPVVRHGRTASRWSR